MQATDDALYFWSGSNRPGEITALAQHGHAIGVSVDALDRGGRGIAALEDLAPGKRAVVNVTQTNGRPILMLGSSRDKLPTGDVEVEADGKRLTFGFRKIAVNVAKAAQGGANVLGSVLRGMFGEDAGARGKGHKAVIELTSAGWQMSAEDLKAAKISGAKVFVDSGAFGEVKFSPELGKMVDVRPISDEDWRERLAAYHRITTALGSNTYLVAPDKVGDQDETLRRLERYAPEMRKLRDMGAHIIVPIQLGEMTGADFDRACSEVLGFSDYIRGIPSKKAAATIEEIAELSASLPEDARIHLLGLGPFGERFQKVIAAIDRVPELVFCDSVRIKALVGRSNGPGGAPRILTILTDVAKRFFGLPLDRPAPLAFADRVKHHALDIYFSEHFVGV